MHAQVFLFVQVYIVGNFDILLNLVKRGEKENNRGLYYDMIAYSVTCAFAGCPTDDSRLQACSSIIDPT